VIRAEQLLKKGLDTPDMANRAELLNRLEGLYVESGRDDEAESVREEIQRLPKVTETTSVTMTDESMQLKTTFDYGEDGIPLEEFGDLAGSLKSHAPLSTENPPAAKGVEKPRVGRNSPCPCGSGKKFKKCCARK